MPYTDITSTHYPNPLLGKPARFFSQEIETKLLTVGEIRGLEWHPYTPVWDATTTSPSLGNGTVTGKYTRLADTVWFWARITMGSTTTYGSGIYNLTIPPPSNDGDTNGIPVAFQLRDSGSSAEYPAAGRIDSNDKIAAWGLSSGNRVGPTQPFTWATGDSFRVSGFYKTDSPPV